MRSQYNIETKLPWVILENQRVYVIGGGKYVNEKLVETDEVKSAGVSNVKSKMKL